MILSGKQINNQINKSIFIDPFNPVQLNPNSYNLKLHKELMVYDHHQLDMKKQNTAHKIIIPEDGLLLKPNQLYLGRTVEYTRTDKFVPMLEGRSSIGRLGMFIHITAGFGDIGFEGYWTLEIFVIQPLVIYPNVEICQIYYHSIDGDYDAYKEGKYQKNKDIQPSMLFKDFQK